MSETEDRLRHVERQLAVIVERIDNHTEQDTRNFEDLKSGLTKLETKLDLLGETVGSAAAARNAERRLVLVIAGLISTFVSIIGGLFSIL